jgi:polysaccharide export outer membrane protein
MKVSKDLLKRFAIRLGIGMTVLSLALAVVGVARADTASYRLHSGDQLNVVVYGEQTLTGPVTVLPDGTITLPLAGKVHVAGQTPDQAAETISSALKKYVRNPVVTVAVTQVGQVNVLVLGAVKTPGKYALPPSGTLTDAIGAAGGINAIAGAYPDAHVAAHGAAKQVSLERLLHGGDASLNIPLEDGAIVYIPSPQIIAIRVVGSVDHPGEVDLNEGDRLSMAIAKAGNSSSANADLNNIAVTRTSPEGKSTVMRINLYKTLEGGDVSKDLVMEKGDLVYVPQVKKNGFAGIGSSLYYLLSTLRLVVP